jgi:FixJ family two-component response regulator
MAHEPSPTAPSPPPTVFIVDDDDSFRKAVARLLRAAGFTVETFESAAAFLARPATDEPGCALIDLQMPGVTGLELQDLLTAQPGHHLPIIFLTGHGDIPTSVHAMRQGAEDFLTKMASKEQLVQAVSRALARDACEREAQTRQTTVRARLAQLSPRELEVLAQLTQGKLNKQIAADLNIHERTVKLHRTALTKKLGVCSVAELTKLWIAADAAGEGSSPASPPPPTCP